MGVTCMMFCFAVPLGPPYLHRIVATYGRGKRNSGPSEHNFVRGDRDRGDQMTRNAQQPALEARSKLSGPLQGAGATRLLIVAALVPSS